MLREFVAEDTLKEFIEKHFKNSSNERKQKQKDYSELLEELLEEIRGLLIKDTDHEADEAVNKEYNVVIAKLSLTLQKKKRQSSMLPTFINTTRHYAQTQPTLVISMPSLSCYGIL